MTGPPPYQSGPPPGYSRGQGYGGYNGPPQQGPPQHGAPPGYGQQQAPQGYGQQFQGPPSYNQHQPPPGYSGGPTPVDSSDPAYPPQQAMYPPP